MTFSLGDRIEVVGKGIGVIQDMVVMAGVAYYVVLLDEGGQMLVRVA